MADIVTTIRNPGSGSMSFERPRGTEKCVALEGDETMKKFILAIAGASVLAAGTIGLAGPAAAAVPFAPLDDPCSVHVHHGGSDVDVRWC
jgi:hypothetical protein